MINSYTITSQPIAVDDTLNFNVSRILTGCTVNHVDGSPSFTLTKPGYYYVTFNADVLGTAAGDVTAELINGSVAVPGATATTTIAVGETANIAFATIIRVLPSCAAIDNTTILTVLNSGVAATYTNANINITKLC
jgi:hypothetical protein